jgi:hypothetical protein
VVPPEVLLLHHQFQSDLHHLHLALLQVNPKPLYHLKINL